MVNLLTKFEVSMFIRYEDAKTANKNVEIWVVLCG